MAIYEIMILKRTIIHISDHLIYLKFFIAISMAVVPARSPDRVMDSPYDGRKNGKNIITKTKQCR